MPTRSPHLTVLTDPIPYGRELIPQTLKRTARRIKYLFRQRSYFSHPEYRGHFAVTRSLVQGLTRIGARFNYAPIRTSGLAKRVLVLAGVDTLRQAIRLKRAGLIDKLFAGPNIVVFSTDAESIIASPEIDAVITPSPIVSDLYAEDHVALKGKIFSWPAGVDMDYWAPASGTVRDRVLIYEKQNKGPVGPVHPYASLLRNQGWTVEIIRYGSYRHEDYRRHLQRALVMIGFVTDESQGIAWAEAWASDVPTLIWRNTTNVYRNRTYNCSTAPYLCNSNGLFFNDIEDFKRQFSHWNAHRDTFKPRAWARANMSDEACARELYDRLLAC